MPKEPKSKKSGGRAKFEKIDLQEALKDVTAPTIPSFPAPSPDDGAEHGYSMHMTEVALQAEAPVSPSPAPAPTMPAAAVAPDVTALGDGAPLTASRDYVPITAVGTTQVDRMREATYGLLKEPGPPPPGIPRVTKEGESSPPMPTELMQLLTA